MNLKYFSYGAIILLAFFILYPLRGFVVFPNHDLNSTLYTGPNLFNGAWVVKDSKDGLKIILSDLDNLNKQNARVFLAGQEVKDVKFGWVYTGNGSSPILNLEWMTESKLNQVNLMGYLVNNQWVLRGSYAVGKASIPGEKSGLSNDITLSRIN